MVCMRVCVRRKGGVTVPIAEDIWEGEDDGVR